MLLHVFNAADAHLIRKDDAAEKARQEALKAKTEAAIEAVEAEHK